MQPANHILSVPRCSYFLALVDYGPKLGIGLTTSSGNPEATRADIVSEVRSHIASDRCIIHVKWVEGNFLADVTEEILSEAIYQLEHEAA